MVLLSNMEINVVGNEWGDDDDNDDAIDDDDEVAAANTFLCKVKGNWTLTNICTHIYIQFWQLRIKYYASIRQKCASM